MTTLALMQLRGAMEREAERYFPDKDHRAIAEAWYRRAAEARRKDAKLAGEFLFNPETVRQVTAIVKGEDPRRKSE